MDMVSAWSEGVRKQGVWLGGLLPYERAAEVWARIGQVHIAPSSIWREAQVFGERLHALEEKERAESVILPGKWEDVPIVEKKKRMGVAMDGGMLFVLGEGWKEMKVGSVFEVQSEQGVDEQSGEPVAMPVATAMSYVAHLGGTEPFGVLLWSEARRRKWWRASETEVVGDGASWIWNQSALHFGDSLQVVDWYHAKEHLVAAVRLLHPQDETAFAKTLSRLETLLYRGHARQIADNLDLAAAARPSQAEALHKEAAYFRSNQRRMNYMELREGRWLIGSGTVESGAKQYKERLCGPGMRWSRKGIENLIPIRSALLSGRFDQVWDAVRPSPPN